MSASWHLLSWSEKYCAVAAALPEWSSFGASWGDELLPLIEALKQRRLHGDWVEHLARIAGVITPAASDPDVAADLMIAALANSEWCLDAAALALLLSVAIMPTRPT